MKKSLKTGFWVVLASMFTLHLQAQKFGHVNSGNILSELPGTKAADTALKSYQDSLVTIGEANAQKLQKEFEAFYTKYQAGEVPPALAQQKQAEFQQQEQRLIAYEDEVMNLVAKKRQDLLEPILTKLQTAIDEVGKEGNYTMIFDTSIFNTILFAQETDDLGTLVKAKLNL